MYVAVEDNWLEIVAGGHSSRLELSRGLTRVGGPGADYVLEHAPRGELHFWNDPPKVVYLGDEPRAEVNGKPLEEEPLQDGDQVRWADHHFTFHLAQAPIVLEELSREPIAGPARTNPAWERVQAGMLVELGLADRKVAKRWQDSVVRGEFSAAPCAADILRASEVAADDSRLLERSGRLLRDFLMSPLSKGAAGGSRKMRAATKSGLAMIVAQFVVVGIYTLILLVILVLVRLKWDTSIDGIIDSILNR